MNTTDRLYIFVGLFAILVGTGFTCDAVVSEEKPNTIHSAPVFSVSEPLELASVDADGHVKIATGHTCHEALDIVVRQLFTEGAKDLPLKLKQKIVESIGAKDCEAALVAIAAETKAKPEEKTEPPK